MMNLATVTGELGAVVSLSSAWQSAASTLATSIWQAAVIACGLEIAFKLMPRISAAHRFAVWAAGFVVAAGLPMLPALSFASGANGSTVSGSGGAPSGPLVQVDARWALAIATVWVLAASWRMVHLALHSIRLRRVWKAALPVEVSQLLLNRIKDVRGGRVEICTTEKLDRPSVIGFLAPRILIPAWLMPRLTPEELEQIVLHESQHLRRGDDWTNLAQKLVMVMFPLNPALAWMEHRLCREREMACDEGVVRITHAPRAYAACLASLAEHGLDRRAEALSLGAWHRRSELVQRVHGILWRKQVLSKGASIALAGTLGCALIGGSLEMARCPQVVAFVSHQPVLAMTPERQRELADMLAREDAEAKASLPKEFRAMAAKAIVPASASVGKKANHVSHRRPAAVEDVQQDVAGDRVNPEGARQEWVVLTAYEEIQTATRTSAPLVSDFDANASTENDSAQKTAEPGASSASAQGSPAPGNQTAGRYAVTRLILKVVPANSNGNAIGVIHSWFVIQL